MGGFQNVGTKGIAGIDMGMGMGMSQADVIKMQLMQAKAERKTLAGRIAVTKKSIEILEKSLPPQTEDDSDGMGQCFWVSSPPTSNSFAPTS